MDDRLLKLGWSVLTGVGVCLVVGACSATGSELVAESVAEAFTATDGDGDAVDFGENPRFVAFCSEWDEGGPTPAVIMLYGTDEMIDFVANVVLGDEGDVDEVDTAGFTSFLSIRAALSEVADGGTFALAEPPTSDEGGMVDVFLFDADVPVGIRQGEYISGAGEGSGDITVGPVACEKGLEIAVELEAELLSEFSDGGVATVNGNVVATVAPQVLTAD